MTQQGMGTDGKPSKCCSCDSDEAVRQGDVQKWCLLSLLNSRCANDNSSSRGTETSKHPQAVRRDGVGQWPSASGAVLCGTETKEA